MVARAFNHAHLSSVEFKTRLFEHVFVVGSTNIFQQKLQMARSYAFLRGSGLVLTALR